jgi:hypothetical protein
MYHMFVFHKLFPMNVEMITLCNLDILQCLKSKLKVDFFKKIMFYQKLNRPLKELFFSNLREESYFFFTF